MSFTKECRLGTVEEAEAFHINKELLAATKSWEYNHHSNYQLSYDKNTVTIERNGVYHKVPVSIKYMPKKAFRYYFVCPYCGEQYSILYYDEHYDELKCRKCLRLVYQCQKERIYRFPKWMEPIRHYFE
jgi:hypothetical protein